MNPHVNLKLLVMVGQKVVMVGQETVMVGQETVMVRQMPTHGYAPAITSFSWVTLHYLTSEY